MLQRVIPFGFLLAACAPSEDRPAVASPKPPATSAPLVTAFVGGTVIASPDAAPLTDGVVLVEGDRIVRVGPRAEVPVPAGARVVSAVGGTVLAGFWNSHVHVTEAPFEDAAHKSASTLGAALDDLCLRWGFVHVVDTGSFPENTLALRRRIASGEVRGPALLTLGAPLVAVGGQPRYVPVPLPQLKDPEMARAFATQELEAGVDGIKLMTVSVVAHPPAPVMPKEVVRAVTETAHARGAFVAAHPTTMEGARVAAEGGVDVIAHTTPGTGPWSPVDVADLRRANVALVPTLKLWHFEIPEGEERARYEAAALQQVRAYADAGGAIFFGTDVGYMTDHDPTEEYALLAKAGLGFSSILASLTTAPAERWTHGRQHGRLAVGEPADVVVLDGDPTHDVGAWSRVRHAFLGGRELH